MAGPWNNAFLTSEGVSFVPFELIRWNMIYFASIDDSPESIFKVTERIDISSCSKYVKSSILRD